MGLASQLHIYNIENYELSGITKPFELLSISIIYV